MGADVKFWDDVTIVSPEGGSSGGSDGGVTVRGTLQNTSRTESEGEFSTTDWLLLLPKGTAINMEDRVLVNGAEFEVQGEPYEFTNDLTINMPHHVEANLKITGQSDPSTDFPDDEAF